MGSRKQARTRSAPTALIAAGVVLILVLGALVWWFRLRGLAPGDLVETRAAVSGEKVTAHLPGATMTFAVGGTKAQLPERAVRGAGTYVGVSWTLEPAADGDPTVLAAGKALQPKVALVADGKRFDLDAGESKFDDDKRAVAKKNVYVALTDTPKQLHLEVTYDGLTQRFDVHTGKATTGAAAPYYTQPFEPLNRYKAKNCPGLRIKGADLDFRNKGKVECEVRPIVTVPYADGLGWAKEGRAWLVVPITTAAELPAFAYWPSIIAPDPVSIYDMRLDGSEVTLDGEKPAAELDLYSESESRLTEMNLSGRIYVFDVKVDDGAHRLVFKQVFRDSLSASERKRNPKAPRDRTATARFSIRVQPLKVS